MAKKPTILDGYAKKRRAESQRIMDNFELAFEVLDEQQLRQLASIFASGSEWLNKLRDAHVDFYQLVGVAFALNEAGLLELRDKAKMAEWQAQYLHASDEMADMILGPEAFFTSRKKPKS